MMYLIQSFRDGELWQSEGLAAFSIIIFLKRVPSWQNDAFASLKLTFNLTSYMKDRKNKNTEKKHVAKMGKKQKTAYPSLLISH